MKKIIASLFVFLCSMAATKSGFGQIESTRPTEQDMAAYLMVYFKDETHGIYMALSKDGNRFTDINNAKPVISPDTLAAQRGVRDPYITRGRDGLFYMAMTDLHIFAQKEGIRETEWERDAGKYGWGNNRGLVLMKSADLIHWSHQVLRVDQSFPELAEIGCAWAPELIYDSIQDKMMIYFTMRFGNGINKIYYTHLNKDFTALEGPPKLLFNYPVETSYIDADITKVQGKYHLFYVPHDGTPGIKQMVSDSISSGYVYDQKWYDSEAGACEAPNVFKRIGKDVWVLVYDVYSIEPHNFGFRETEDFIHFKDLGHFNQGVMKATNFSSPKHPSVIHLTKKEAAHLSRYWNLEQKKYR